MKKFFTTLKNIWSIVELRDKILITIGFLVIYRVGSFIVLPGIDTDIILDPSRKPEGLLGLLDTFSGGAFSNASIFGLGIMPYISASIVIQLLTVAMPYFQKMQKEGESGRKRINQITRVLTIVICLSQSVAYIKGTIPSEGIVINETIFLFLSMIILTSGTIFCMWLGERITDKGIGNGISMLIMIGIISRLPGGFFMEMMSKGLNGALLFIIEIVVLFFVVMGVVALTQAVRKIPVQYAKQIVGNKVYGGQRQYIPLKVNSAGVMPIIFAQALMFLPGMLGNYFVDKNDFLANIGFAFASFTSPAYNILLATLIIVFTFFYTAITINPTQIADDMKRNGGFVPGIKPGKQTSEFIDSILTKITLPGSIFLALVAILPAFAVLAGVTQGFATFYGGTSLLIMVGVILDTLQQIESYLLMRHYEGMMKSGKIKGRSQVAVA
jgi:preprotein translocase subunit SecY